MANHATPSPSATSSPAKTLRRAAEELREDARLFPTDGHEFRLAVADLLDDMASDAYLGSIARGRALVIARTVVQGMA